MDNTARKDDLNSFLTNLKAGLNKNNRGIRDKFKIRKSRWVFNLSHILLLTLAFSVIVAQENFHKNETNQLKRQLVHNRVVVNKLNANLQLANELLLQALEEKAEASGGTNPPEQKASFSSLVPNSETIVAKVKKSVTAGAIRLPQVRKKGKAEARTSVSRLSTPVTRHVEKPNVKSELPLEKKIKPVVNKTVKPLKKTWIIEPIKTILPKSIQPVNQQKYLELKK